MRTLQKLQSRTQRKRVRAVIFVFPRVSHGGDFYCLAALRHLTDHNVQRSMEREVRVQLTHRTKERVCGAAPGRDMAEQGHPSSAAPASCCPNRPPQRDDAPMTTSDPPFPSALSPTAVRIVLAPHSLVPNLPYAEVEPLPSNVEAQAASLRSGDRSSLRHPLTHEQFGRMALHELLHALGADVHGGLDQAEADRRLLRDGPNELKRHERPSTWRLFWSNVSNPIVVLLIISAVVSLALKEWAEGVAIMVTVIANASIGTYSEKSSGDALEALMAMTAPTCKVRRKGASAHTVRSLEEQAHHVAGSSVFVAKDVETGGIPAQQHCSNSRDYTVIPAREAVVGDILVLEAGDVVAADVRLISCVECRVDEAMLTGESKDVTKDANWRSDADQEAGLSAANMCFSGTHIATGHALGVVVAVGMKTRIGRIAALLLGRRKMEDDEQPVAEAEHSALIQADIELGPHQRATRVRAEQSANSPPIEVLQSSKKESTSTDTTPLQMALKRVGFTMAAVGIVACILVFAIGMGIGYSDSTEPNQERWLLLLLIAVTLAVSAIPEGLPLATTIALAMGSVRLARANTIVRKLPAVEALGSVTVICSDKTGTITAGKMTATHLYTQGRLYEISGKGFERTGAITHKGQDMCNMSAKESMGVHAALLLSGCLCNNTSLVDEGGKTTVKGSSTEAPLVVAAAKLDLTASASLHAMFPRLAEVPFTSKRKMMATLHVNAALEQGTTSVAHTASVAASSKNDRYCSSSIDEKKSDEIFLTKPRAPAPPRELHVIPVSGTDMTAPLARLFPGADAFFTSPVFAAVKGAPNYVVPLCTRSVGADGSIVSMGEEERQLTLAMVDDLSAQALRVLAVAYTPMQSAPKDEDMSTQLDTWMQAPIFVGLVASIDPPRGGIRSAIETAANAGIRTIMITGQ